MEKMQEQKIEMKPPVLPEKVDLPPVAVSDMIPHLPEPDYNALKKGKRGDMSLATVATIQKTYAKKEPDHKEKDMQIKPPSSGLRAGWKGGK